VTAGPTCPVERPDQPCPPKPVSGTVTALQNGVTVTSTVTDGAGHYALNLNAGTYSIVVDTGSVFPRCPTSNVTVAAGQRTHADIGCDTGIR
jgi:hypothetical protein